jgi:hypothetical protein
VLTGGHERAEAAFAVVVHQDVLGDDQPQPASSARRAQSSSSNSPTPNCSSSGPIRSKTSRRMAVQNMVSIDRSNTRPAWLCERRSAEATSSP